MCEWVGREEGMGCGVVRGVRVDVKPVHVRVCAQLREVVMIVKGKGMVLRCCEECTG